MHIYLDIIISYINFVVQPLNIKIHLKNKHLHYRDKHIHFSFNLIKMFMIKCICLSNGYHQNNYIILIYKIV